MSSEEVFKMAFADGKLPFPPQSEEDLDAYAIRVPMAAREYLLNLLAGNEVRSTIEEGMAILAINAPRAAREFVLNLLISDEVRFTIEQLRLQGEQA